MTLDNNNIKCKCGICGNVFLELNIVIVSSQEYAGGKLWDNYVSPCCLSENFEEVEDES